MLDVNKLKRHAALFDRTAAKLGHDLPAKALRGEVSIDALTDAVLRCANCPSPEKCAKWLDEAAKPEEDAPEYCQNREWFGEI